MELEEIKNILYRAYEVESIYDGECGCYVNGYWLSIDSILEILKKEMY